MEKYMVVEIWFKVIEIGQNVYEPGSFIY